MSSAEKKARAKKKKALMKKCEAIRDANRVLRHSRMAVKRADRAAQRHTEKLEQKRLKAEKRAEAQAAEDAELHRIEMLANRAAAGESLIDQNRSHETQMAQAL